MNVSQAVSLGIWPALPLTGYWAFYRFWRTTETKPCPAIASAALTATAGIAIWSFPLLAAAIVGIYSSEYFGGIGWFVTLVSMLVLLKRHGPMNRRRTKLDAWDGILGFGLLTAASLYFAFPTEILSADHDEGIYVNHAIYIARHGQLDIPYTWSQGFESDFRNALGRFKAHGPPVTV